MILLYIIAS